DSGIGKGKGNDTDDAVWVSLGGHGKDDAESARTTARKGPVKVFIPVGWGGDNVAPVGKNNLPFESLVSRETVLVVQDSMSTTLSVSSSKTNTRARATSNTQSILSCQRESLESLDTCTHANSLASIVFRLVDEDG